MAQVLMPHQRESDLDTILKGLQVAGGIYGLYTNTKELELKKAQMDQMAAEKQTATAEKADATAGIISLGELKKGERSGDQVSAIPIPGAVKVQVREDEGLKEVYIKPASVIAAEIAAQNRTADKIATSTKEKTDREISLRKEYDSDEITKANKLSIDALKRLEAAVKNPHQGGAKSNAAIYAWASIQDPRGRVTDADFRAGEVSGGLLSQMKMLKEKAETGGGLDQPTLDRMLVQAKISLKNKLEFQKQVDDRYFQLSKSYSVDPHNVIDSNFDHYREQLADYGLVDEQPGQGISSKGLPGESDAQAKEKKPFSIDDYIYGNATK